MTKIIEHKKNDLGVKLELHDFTQDQMEKYQEYVNEANQAAKSGMAFNSIIVRGAITAGFLTGTTSEQVGALAPWKVLFITKRVLEFVTEQVTVPPE